MAKGFTRRELGNHLAAITGAATIATKAAAQVRNASPGPALDIAEWSYHWYGVEHATLARGTVCNGMQMYVEHWIPAQVKHPYPVVLIHGGYGQGTDWMSTPDGRRGWATMLLEEGYKVYVTDRPGQGRNPYQPFIHGNFDRQAPTFEAAAKRIGVAATDPAAAQLVASMGQPMANNANTRNVWRTRGAMLLDDIGPSILITHGDGVVFAQVTAEERPKLVKAIVAVEPAAQLNDPIGVPFQSVPVDAAIGPMRMMAKNNREILRPILTWLDKTATAQPAMAAVPDPHPNTESTGFRLADQGCFWVGVQRKTMPYGTIAQGQMYVQYMIPAELRHPFPVVMTHGGGGQGCHMMGIGGRPGFVHDFLQAGFAVYWLDRPSYGRSPYHPDALGPSHLPNVPPYEGLITSTAVFNTAQ